MPDYMKNLHLFAFIGLLLISCYSTFRTNQTIDNFDDNITLKINKVMEGYSLATANGHWSPKRGYKFVILFITFENKTSDRKTMNFENIFLFDMANKTKYKLESIMLKGPINIYDDTDASIGPNKSKERKLVFSYPEDMKPEYFLVNNRAIKIEYES